MLVIIPRIVFRLVLPLVLLISWIVRPSLISASYGALLLVSPFIAGVKKGFAPSTRRYVLSCVGISTLAVLGQAVFHIVLAVYSPYGEVVPDCGQTASILRMIGLYRLNIPSVLHVVRLVCPDVAVWLTSIATLLLLTFYGRYEQRLPTTQSNQDAPETSRADEAAVGAQSRWLTLAALVSDVAALALLCAAGVILPSLLSAPYFMAFLVAVTWWAAAAKPLAVACFGCVKLALVTYAAVHILLLYLYQTYQFQSALQPESLASRLLGLTAVVNSTCTEFWSISLVSGHGWPVYANPLVLFVFYIYTAFQTICSYRVVSKSLRRQQGEATGDELSSIHEELLPSESEEPTQSSRQEPKSDGGSGGRSGGGRYSVVGFVVSHSYALALISMMCWAITYHSWLSLVWLLLACLIWMMTNTRKTCLVLSPFIVIYAEALLCLQFIYGLNLTQSELPDSTEAVGVPLQQIGLIKPTGAACVPLFVKTLFCVPFWMVLGLWIYERGAGRDGGGRTSYGTFESTGSSGHGAGEAWVSSVLIKYWIYVVALVLLLISIRTPVVAYEVCYMAFFVVLITVLQASFRLWRVMLFLYWTILTAFSIAVLLAVYTYQFTDVPRWWNRTHWPQEIFLDLGLVSYDSASLFVQLLTPLSFLAVVILQMKFFHTGFMRLTNISSARDTGPSESILANAGVSSAGSKRSDSPQPSRTWWQTAKEYCKTVRELLWRIADLHFPKLVSFSLVMLAAREVSAVNVVLVVMVCLMVPCRRLHTLLSVLATIWIALVVLTKMIYQMRFVHIETLSLDVFNQNCSDLFNGSIQKDSPAWAGFTKLKKDQTVANYLQDYVIVLLVLAVQAVVRIRQRYHRRVMAQPTPARAVLFPNIGRTEADETISRCCMFLANYGFYKFGVEITLIMVIIDVGVRMDAVAFLYALWVMLLVAAPRRVQSGVWWLFVVFVSVALAVQYAVCVGLPPSSCLQYPWSSVLDSSLVYWLYLPSYVLPPNVYYLIADFFVLLTASAQCHVFRIERSCEEGGDNWPIPRGGAAEDGQPVRNPTPNFITFTKSYLDLLKLFVFLYFHWITLFVVFATGVAGISAFALGYLVAAFTLLWKGNDLYLEPQRRVMIRWYLLLFYNIFAILLKVAMEVVGCVYVCNLCRSASWLIQLLSIACLRGPPPLCPLEGTCKAMPAESEIVYDAVCFGFLVFQLRIFGAWYFRHSVAEFRAERILSARGAYLMNMLITREMNKQKEAEDRVLQNVKDATGRIRERYLAQMEGQKQFEPNTYADAKRAGDYYMFNEDEYKKDKPESETFEPEPTAPETTAGADVERIGPAQLLHIAGQRDLDIQEIVTAAEKRDAEIRASSSKSEQGTEEAETAPDDGEVGKLGEAGKFVKMFLVSILNHLTFTFNRWSRDYRYVAFVLKGEKQRLKERLMKELETEDDFGRVRETIFNNDVSRDVQRVRTHADIEETEREASELEMEHNAVVRYLVATYYVLVSHTELLCYLMIVLDQMGNAAVISLPLPFFAFFWGTLCSPRPPKFFWVTIITYTEAMIVVKFMFQFGFWNWNVSSDADPLYLPRILGIERKDYYAAYDVALLMVLFFHRYVLKRLGLWKDVAGEQSVEVDADVDGSSAAHKDQELAPRVDEEEVESAEKKVEGGAQSAGRMAYCACFVEFYRRLLRPVLRYIMDLYVFMFLCDLICFLILVFGYSSFGVSAGQQNDVVADITSNRVPLPFVLMLITLMVLIIVDRAIYLRKSVVAKLVFQYLLVTALHAWLFFGLPALTDTPISGNTAAKLFYFIKCLYFILSAWQIRNSYPSRVQGNLLTKRFGMTNYVLFTGFMALPFLFELRTTIDWVWTETSMPLFDYFTMENMYACVFRCKCMRKFEKEYPVPRGVPKAVLVKYGMGVPILIIIIILLWLPLLLFALVNAIGTWSPPVHAQFSIVIEGYPPLYAMEAQRSYLRPIDSSEYSELTNLCRKNKAALEFLKDYGEADIYKAQFRGGASKFWTITDPSRRALIDDLGNSTAQVHVSLNWELRRNRTTKGQGLTQSDGYSVTLAEGDPARLALLDMINGGGGEGGWVNISTAFPPFIVMPSVGSAGPASPILRVGSNTTIPSSYAGVGLQLNVDDNQFRYWKVSTIKPTWMGEYSLETDNIEMTVFVDRVFPSALDSVISGGIIGAYIAVVLVVGRFMRTLVVNSPLDVILSEMPDVDRIVQLCQNVFLVREARDFYLEQDLFAKLVFLFRSPEMLIRWTRPKVE